jgi:hypothetical protein
METRSRSLARVGHVANPAPYLLVPENSLELRRTAFCELRMLMK